MSSDFLLADDPLLSNPAPDPLLGRLSYPDPDPLRSKPAPDPRRPRLLSRFAKDEWVASL